MAFFFQASPGSLAFLHQVPELLEAALDEAGDGHGTAAEVGADLGQRQALPVLQDQGFALGFGQLLEGLGQADGLFGLLGVLARRGLVRGRARPRAVRTRYSGPPAAIARGTDRPWHGQNGQGQVVGQDLSQPGRPTPPRSGRGTG